MWIYVSPRRWTYFLTVRIRLLCFTINGGMDGWKDGTLMRMKRDQANSPGYVRILSKTVSNKIKRLYDLPH